MISISTRYQPVLQVLVLASLIWLSNIHAHADSDIPPQRIISLAPHITELLFAIGAGGQIAATVEHSDYPATALDIPRIGNVYQLDWERLLGLKPDLIIAWQGGTPAHVVARLRDLDLPLKQVRVHSLDGIAEQIISLGALTGQQINAMAVASGFREQLLSLEKRYGDHSPVTVFFEIDHTPLYTVNADQIISDAIRVCGGTNIFADLPALAAQISIESVLQRSPELIVYAGSSQSPEQVFADWKRWKTLPAVRTGQLLSIKPDDISRATPRMLKGVAQLCEAIQAARTAKGVSPGHH